jgi:metabolite-proton symporter
MTPASAPPANTTGRIVVASFVGTAIEFYDFYVYATAAALVFGPLFFPQESAAAQQLLSFATFAIAFIARPLGSALFGHFGDRVGRKSTLVASLMIMGISTTAVGLLPTYAAIGVAAPLLLCLLRFGQGIGLGGEWGGAALLAVENAPPGRRGWFGMFPQLGAPVGFIAANGLFLLLAMVLSDEQFRAWGWRIPFLMSAALLAVGLYVRLKLTETPLFREAMDRDERQKVPLGTLLRRHPRDTVLGTLSMVACYAVFYLATVFALGYGTRTLGYTREAFLALLCLAIVFMALGIPIAAWLSDRFGRRPVLLAGLVGTVAVGGLLGPMLGSGSAALVGLFLCLALFNMGLIFGPMGAVLSELFPTRVRYTGASVTYNMGGILGASLAPVIAQLLAERGGLDWVGYYLIAAAIVSFAAIWSLRETRDEPLGIREDGR